MMAKRRVKTLSRSAKENDGLSSNPSCSSKLGSPFSGACDIGEISRGSPCGNEGFTPMSPIPGVANPQVQTPSPDSRVHEYENGTEHMKRPQTIDLDGTLDELLDSILNEVRTAGLRKGRENVLVDLLGELRQAGREQKLSCKKAVKEWAIFAESNGSKANRLSHEVEEKSLECERVLRECQLEAKRRGEASSESLRKLRQELSGVKLELDGSKRLVLDERKGHEQVLERKEVEARERLQREISRTKSRLVREAEKKAAKCVESVSAEFLIKIEALKARVAEGESFGARCEVLEKELETHERRRDEENEQWEAERNERGRAMESLMEENNMLLKGRTVMEEELKRLREEKAEEVANQRERRRVEFEKVEARVKEVVGKKDAIIKSLLERAEVAERRGAQLQHFLSELDARIE